jgi:hypothetical protein
MLRAGVAKVGLFREGDSGRGRDGRPGARICGLGARPTPGPTDCESLGIDGVGGEPAASLESWNWKPGVVGVGGNELSVSVGDMRFWAR